MNILVSLNSNYIGPLTVMLKSLMLSDIEECFDIYVAHSSLTENDFNKMKKVCDMNRTVFHGIEVPSSLLENAPVLKRISKETYYRLLTNDILPENVERILYLDPDIVILKSLKDFYNIDFGDNIYAGAGHTVGTLEKLNVKRLKMPKNSSYINAGVLMINVKGMRKFCTTDDIFSYMQLNRKKLYLADQDVINGFFAEKIIYVDPVKYNLDEKTFYNFRKRKNLSLKKVREECCIIHYNGSQKPWKEKYHGNLSEFYFHFKNEIEKKSP